MIQLLALHLTNNAGDIQRSNSDSLTRVTFVLKCDMMVLTKYQFVMS